MRALVAVVAVLVGVLLLLELLAVPLGGRQLREAVDARVDAAEEVEITGLRRPAAPGLLLGRARDVEVTATGVEVGVVRLDRVRVWADEVDLAWRPGAPSSRPADAEIRVLEGDVQHALREFAPVPLPVEVDLRPGVVALGAPLVPVALEVAVEVETDGTVVLRPAGGLELLDRLGLARRFPPTGDVRFTGITIGVGELTATADVTLEAGDGRGRAGRTAQARRAEVVR